MNKQKNSKLTLRNVKNIKQNNTFRYVKKGKRTSYKKN